MSRPSRSRAIAIANPSLSRDQLAAARKRERKAEEMRQSQLARQDEAVPTARKVGKEYPGGPAWDWNPPQAKATIHHDDAITLNGTVAYRQSPTVSGKGRSVAHNGDAAGEEVAIESAWMARAFDRVATKAGIPRAMVDAIGMQMTGCSVEEIAGTLGVTRGTVKGYLERGKAKMRDAVSVKVGHESFPCAVACDGEIQLTEDARAALPQSSRGDVFSIASLGLPTAPSPHRR